jgi:hypothetical protein
MREATGGADRAGAEAERRGRAAAQLRRQARWCHDLGSRLYGALLDAAAGDCEAGGPAWAVLEGHEDARLADALAIRFLGSVHRLVLAGEAPELARHYSSVGGEAREGEDAWPAFRAVLASQRERLRALLSRPVQTNEVGRAASLLGGFLAVARETGLPLRLLEVGASAGLNLRFDRFRYESQGFAWGDPDSPVRLRAIFEGDPPPLGGPVEVASREGCDAAPVDPFSEEGRATLRAYLWPDQVERRARLDAALAVAKRVPARVERADACEWTLRRLERPAPGRATVVYHSIVMQYLGRERALRFAEIVRGAGGRASAESPLAWLYLEPRPRGAGEFDHLVRLTVWPGGEERTLAASSPHGPPVRWLASPDAVTAGRAASAPGRSGTPGRARSRGARS